MYNIYTYIVGKRLQMFLFMIFFGFFNSREVFVRGLGIVKKKEKKEKKINNKKKHISGTWIEQ